MFLKRFPTIESVVQVTHQPRKSIALSASRLAVQERNKRNYDASLLALKQATFRCQVCLTSRTIDGRSVTRDEQNELANALEVLLVTRRNLKLTVANCSPPIYQLLRSGQVYGRPTLELVAIFERLRITTVPEFLEKKTRNHSNALPFALRFMKVCPWEALR